MEGKVPMVKTSLALMAAIIAIAATGTTGIKDISMKQTQADKFIYQLEQRQYEENPEATIEYELEREWLKQTAILSIEDPEDETVIINEYLAQRGIRKTIPDSITYYNGSPFIKYYEDKDSGKFAFTATILTDNSSHKYVYCGVAYSEDLKKDGSLVYDFDQNGQLLSEKLYDNQGEQVTSVSYTYDESIPFPIITDYENSYGEEGRFFGSEYLNPGQRFWVYDQMLEFDENTRWVKYNGNLFDNFGPEDGIESYSTPVYSEDGRLNAIIETLRGSRYQDNPDEWIEDGRIDFTYSSNGSLAEAEYGSFSGTHGSSGNSGFVYYDKYGRVLYIDSFHSSGNYNYFYLYHNDERYPFAVFEIGGMAYSSDEYEGYSMLFGMGLDVRFMLNK